MELLGIIAEISLIRGYIWAWDIVTLGGVSGWDLLWVKS